MAEHGIVGDIALPSIKSLKQQLTAAEAQIAFLQSELESLMLVNANLTRQLAVRSWHTDMDDY